VGLLQQSADRADPHEAENKHLVGRIEALARKLHALGDEAPEDLLHAVGVMLNCLDQARGERDPDERDTLYEETGRRLSSLELNVFALAEMGRPKYERFIENLKQAEASLSRPPRVVRVRVLRVARASCVSHRRGPRARSHRRRARAPARPDDGEPSPSSDDDDLASSGAA
jgi:hypothetical protein